MNFERIIIKKLFNLYSYDIRFMQHGSIDVITAPNGYGKTTILKILDNLANGRLLYFYNLPFLSINVFLSDGSDIEITQTLTEPENTDYKSDIQLTSDITVEFSWRIEGKVVSHLILNHKILYDAGRRTGLVRRYGFYPDYHDKSIASKVIDQEEFYNAIASEQNQQQFVMLLNGLSTQFISANRIYIDPAKQDNTAPIIEASKKVKDILSTERFNYLVNSQQSVSDFTDKILNDTVILSKEEYIKKTQFLQSRIDELNVFGLIGKISLKPYSSIEADSRILSAYIKELERQLQIYDGILKKLRLFKRLTDEKAFANKHILVSPENGIQVRVEPDNKELDLTELSSGEQNELVMLVEMIFSVSDNSVLLIDEPENSLHVVWQRMLIKNLIEISKQRGLQIIVATHSPRIVAGAGDAVTELFYIQQHE